MVKKIEIDVDDPKLEVNDAKVFSKDVVTTNGIMHSIGEVLIPESLADSPDWTIDPRYLHTSRLSRTAPRESFLFKTGSLSGPKIIQNRANWRLYKPPQSLQLAAPPTQGEVVEWSMAPDSKSDVV